MISLDFDFTDNASKLGQSLVSAHTEHSVLSSAVSLSRLGPGLSARTHRPQQTGRALRCDVRSQVAAERHKGRSVRLASTHGRAVANFLMAVSKSVRTRVMSSSPDAPLDQPLVGSGSGSGGGAPPSLRGSRYGQLESSSELDARAGGPSEASVDPRSRRPKGQQIMRFESLEHAEEPRRRATEPRSRSAR